MSQLLRPVMVFDLDGTLANSIPLIVASYQHAYRTVLGREVGEEEARRWIGMTLASTFAAEGPEAAAQLEETYRVFNRSHIATDTLPYPGVRDLLTTLADAGARLGIVTSKRMESATATLEAVGLTGLIGIVGTMENSARHKPHPDPLLDAMAELGCGPADALYVGDAVVDLQAADAAGVLGIGVGWGAGLWRDMQAQPAYALAATVDELAALLLGA